MPRRALRLLLILVMGMAITACGTDNPPNTSDWCYRFYFKNSDYGVNITEGFWFRYIGLSPDESGHLAVSYTNPNGLIVVPNKVALTLARGLGVEGDIEVAANVSIFGINRNTTGASDTIPADVDSFTLELYPANAGDGSTNFNITAYASDTMAFEALTVSGQGPNPFGTGADNCDGTPTPDPSHPVPTNTGTLVTPSPTPSFTPSPTLTPSRTRTPSPTPTPNGEFCLDVPDPSEDAYPAHITDTSPPGEWYQRFSLLLGTPQQFTITDVVVEYAATGLGMTSEGNLAWGSVYDGPNFIEVESPLGSATGTVEYHDAEGVYASNLHWVIVGVNTGNNEVNAGGNTVVVTNIHIEGLGYPDAFWNDYACLPPTATPTATPTHTTTPPTATLTPNPLTRTANPLISGTPTTVRSATPSPTFVPVVTLPPPATLPPPIATSTVIRTSTPFGTPAGTPAGTATPYTPIPVTGTMGAGEPWATSVGPGIGIQPGGGDGGGGSGCVNSGVITLMCNVINTSSNAMNQAFGYVSQFGSTAIGIVNAYQTAAPVPVPGLPHCATNRLGSELCAIYYILTYTVLSGPIGSWIVPVAVIDVDIFVAFTFLKLVRAILARLAGMLQQ